MAFPNIQNRTFPATPATVSSPGTSGTQRTEFKGSGNAKSPVTRKITREQIERRAYDIYAARGYTPGDQDADWYEAERQLRAGL